MCHNPRYEIRDIVAPAKIRQAMDQQAEAEVWSCCSVLQCVAVCCSVWQRIAVLQCVAVFCRVLQGVAVCCRVIYSVCCSVLPGSNRPSPAEAEACSCTTVLHTFSLLQISMLQMIFQCEAGVYSCDSIS